MAFELSLPSEEDTSILVHFPDQEDLTVDVLDLDVMATQAAEQAEKDDLKYYDVCKNIFEKHYDRTISKFALYQLLVRKNEILEEIKKNPLRSQGSTKPSAMPPVTPAPSKSSPSASPSSGPRPSFDHAPQPPDSPPTEVTSLL